MTNFAHNVCDVAIIGGGAAGSMAAIVLARRGLAVSLIDMHAVHPPEFRCEKVAAGQLELLERLDLVEFLEPIATRLDRMHVVRAGAIHEDIDSVEYGLLYQDFVNSLRQGLPSNVRFVNARVSEIRNSEDEQTIVLSDGDTITTRLAVLATGLGHGLRQKVGINRHIIHDQHSLCMGFSMRPERGRDFEYPALTYYAESTASRLAYISMFPVGSTMRANIFGYHGYREPFVAGMRNDPVSTLFGVMPGLEKHIGRFELIDELKVRMVDLYVAENYDKHGIILIGDAFQTSCPAAGTGLTRCMSDVDRLAANIADLFATPGMSKDKLAVFYNDPQKQAFDAKAAYAASYTRKFATDRGLEWALRRLKVNTRARLHSVLSAFSEPRLSSG